MEVADAVADGQLKVLADAVSKTDVAAAANLANDGRFLLDDLKEGDRAAAIHELVATKQDGDIQPALQALLDRLALLDALGEHAAAINA